MTELHGLSSGRPLVQQRGVSHRHACDVTDHGLVVEERLQATLSDLGLVGRVLGHPVNKTQHNDSTEPGHEDNGTTLMAFTDPRWVRGGHCVSSPPLRVWRNRGQGIADLDRGERNFCPAGAMHTSSHESLSKIKSQDFQLRARYSAPGQLSFK